ncbi:hypothetical protein [Actinokineospora enzanensis]|uniref:hypothetical protein n=1 Tax=Actinokineospora enzanensis TaxID=155975 RepID=UPI0003706FEF|nr:hypothetical protein [Actinokineospora enzanensis]
MALIAAGHHPLAAERLVGPLRETHATAFAVALSGILTYIDHVDPGWATGWVFDATRAWARARGVRLPGTSQV